MRSSHWTILFTASILFFVFFIATTQNPIYRSKKITENTWSSFKKQFITTEGRVIRRKDGQDTVSEGQAYAMLRSIWMNDKKTFDACYRWAENNLSRTQKFNDHLSAWRRQDGVVTDWMPAIDADLDYALSLIFAETKWPRQAPPDLPGYQKQARQVLDDVLRLATVTLAGRLYLTPWIIDSLPGPIPQNPSYYAPAHFRIFYQFSSDERWLTLVDTTYYLLNKLGESFGGAEGVGLIPDWCQIEATGEIRELVGKSKDFAWEAVRIPFRVGLDYDWFKNNSTREFLEKTLMRFSADQKRQGGRIFAGYTYDEGIPQPQEDPLFYASFYFVDATMGKRDDDHWLEEMHRFLDKKENGWFYKDPEDYYVNSLAWMADGLRAGILKNLYKK